MNASCTENLANENKPVIAGQATEGESSWNQDAVTAAGHFSEFLVAARRGVPKCGADEFKAALRQSQGATDAANEFAWLLADSIAKTIWQEQLHFQAGGAAMFLLGLLIAAENGGANAGSAT